MADSKNSRGDAHPANQDPATSDEPSDDVVGKPADDQVDLSEAEAQLADEADIAASDADKSADAAAKAPKSKPIKRNQTVAPVKKAKVTPKQSQAKKSRENKRATPVQFTKQAVAELAKVVWPTANASRQYFVVVLVFVLFIMAFVAGLDALFAWGLLKWLA